MKELVFTFMSFTVIGFSQTQVDLRTQSKSVDFSSATSTRSFQVGQTLPATCIQGAMFFNTSAPAGGNLFGCVAANTWTVQRGSPSFSIGSAGTVVGSESIVDFFAGPGMTSSIGNTGTEITVQNNIDPAVVQTLSNSQSGSALLCPSASGSGSVYTCAMTPTLTLYTPGMGIHWKPDISNTGADPTVNIDTLAAITLKKADGSALSAGDVQGGQLYIIWYDGSVFRIANMGDSDNSVSASFFPALNPVNDAQWTDYGDQSVVVKDAVSTPGKIVYEATGGSSSSGRTIPLTPPFSKVFAVSAFAQGAGSHAGVLMADNAGKSVSCGISNDNANGRMDWLLATNNSPSNVAAFITANQIFWPGNSFDRSQHSILYLRLSADGANNLACDWSMDGSVWLNVLTLPASVFLTPTQAGYYVNPNYSATAGLVILGTN